MLKIIPDSFVFVLHFFFFFKLVEIDSIHKFKNDCMAVHLNFSLLEAPVQLL